MSKFDLISRGTLVCNPGDFSSLQNSAGVASLASSGFPDGGAAKAVRVEYPSSGIAYGQLMHPSPYLDFPFAQADLTGILIEVYNPNAYPMPFTFELYNESGTVRGKGNMAVDVSAEWQLCWLPVSNWATKALTIDDEIRFIRFLFDASLVSGMSPVAAAPLYFGRVYVNPVQRPVFLLSTDDQVAANIINGSGYPTGYPASGGNYKAICDYYGFRATAYVRLDKVGSSGYMTWDQLRALKDDGWTIGSHSASHPEDGGNQGLRMLGPYGMALSWPGAAADDSAIYDDVCLCRDAMLAQGLTDAWHFALPQGGWDLYVRSACLRAGFKSVRAISSATTGYPVRGSKHVGGGNYGSVWHTGWFELAGAIQVDGTPTLANIKAYVDELIRLGATGSCYTHGIDAATATKFDGLCAYLKTKQDAGLIRVLTVAEYYEQGIDWGGRCKFAGTITPPVAFATSTVGEVKRVFTYIGELSASKIEKLAGEKIGTFNLLATDEDEYVQIDI